MPRGGPAPCGPPPPWCLSASNTPPPEVSAGPNCRARYPHYRPRRSRTVGPQDQRTRSRPRWALNSQASGIGIGATMIGLGRFGILCSSVASVALFALAALAWSGGEHRTSTTLGDLLQIDPPQRSLGDIKAGSV